ncbi:hypothetical protein EX30DRAFT_318069 [Ascodesmis nigricans]|uniref:Nucleoporin NUP188 n=1 Tax=Ascodesmis nigricans TaxID=341454 RepID=A0A4V3SJ06_9PEZI|nr:hypothetical protein EX30DRAFT_318069 [Ascodesmis nigricans]
MAPVSTTSDLIDEALKNKTTLPSWHSIYTRITSNSTSTCSHTAISRITSFVLSPTALYSLTHPHAPFPAPSASSKQEFDKLTAPINFSADEPPPENNSSTLPSLAELKDAALQLSRALKVSEVIALRIVLLEHQNRTKKELLVAPGGEGEFASAQIGLEKTFRMTVKEEDPKEKERKIFMDQLHVYFEERRYVIKASTVLYRAAVSGAKKSIWRDVGRQVIEEALNKGGMLANLVEGIQSRWLAGKNEAPAWLKDPLLDDKGDKVVWSWEKQTFLEVIHLQQTLFLQLYRPVEEITARVVKAWFELLQKTGFLTHRYYQPVGMDAQLRELHAYSQNLTTVVSLTMLQLPRCEHVIDEELKSAGSTTSSATPPAQEPEPIPASKGLYIRDAGALQSIWQCLQVLAHIKVAGPTIMGFCVILNAIQSLLAAARSPFDDEPGPRQSPFVEMLQATVPPWFSSTGYPNGIKKLATPAAPNMLQAYQSMLEAADQTAGPRFYLRMEEEGWRMRNVLAHLIRRTTYLFSFSTPFIVAIVLSHDVTYDEFPEFRNHLDEDLEQEKQIAILDSIPPPEEDWYGSPAAKFLADPITEKLIQRAMARFPHEPQPLLLLARSLATENEAALAMITQMTSYTAALPLGYQEYNIATEMEDDNSDSHIVLTDDLMLLAPREGGIFDHTDNDALGPAGSVIIPKGTMGFVSSGSGSRMIVKFDYDFNLLTFLGRILECLLLREGANAKALQATRLDMPDTATEVVLLLTTLVTTSPEARAALVRDPSQDRFPRALEDASDALSRNRDIISIIFDLLDEALNNPCDGESFIVAGIQFLAALIHIVPGRVWPYLARSSLLERKGRGGALSKIISATEVVKGSYVFSLACLDLYERAVEEAVRSAAQYKGKSKAVSLASSRKPSAGAGIGVTDTVQREIILGFTRTAVDIWESFQSFKYAIDMVQKYHIGTRLARIFRNILGLVYGVDTESKSADKLTGVLALGAEHIVNVFLSPEGSRMAFEPILVTIQDGVATPESSLWVKNLNIWITYVTEAVNFGDMLVRVRSYLNLAPSQFEIDLYKSTATLTKLYGAHERYKKCVLELLTSLIKASGSYSEEPPSLLGFLGSQCANHFVTLLSTVDRPYQDVAIETRIWEFVTAVVSNKQQGMSILLLRGETLRQSNGASIAQPQKKRSMLSVCLDGLEEIGRLPVEKALAMLEMVSTAQNFWSLAMDDLGKHPKFLNTITNHVQSITIEFLPADSSEIMTQKAYTIAVAGVIARILALYFHSRRPSEKDMEFFHKLLPKLELYFKRAVQITGYRPSLHAHLAKNFEEKWGGVKLSQIKKTRLARREYGIDAMYDVELGSKVLGFDPGWDRRPDGYRSEVEQANINLSLIQTQVDLSQAWELLAMELCHFAKTSKELRDRLLKNVETCLNENLSSGLPENIFHHIIVRRGEFAFVVVSNLYNIVGSQDIDLSGIFSVAWKCINSSETAFHDALSSGNMDYYRPLLRIIYFCLLSAAQKPKHSTEFAYQVLDLLNVVVAKGFKDLASSAHTPGCCPQDIALVTAILQASQRLKGIDEIHNALSTHLDVNGTMSAATTLFSWSDNLPGGLEDPVYGELAALFLLELSALPIVAEQLAADNALDHIMSSTLAQRLRDATDTDPTSRLYSIWSRALLPLALNLLATIGPNIGREVLNFLSFFQPLLEVSAQRWENQKCTIVLLTSVEEAVAMSMIWAVVKRLGGGEGLKALNIDVAAMCAGVQYLLQHPSYLKTLCVDGEFEKSRAGLETVASLLQNGDDDEQ